MFRCKHCPAAFELKKSLWEHEDRHIYEWKCIECLKYFNSKPAWTYHAKKEGHHEVEKRRRYRILTEIPPTRGNHQSIRPPTPEPIMEVQPATPDILDLQPREEERLSSSSSSSSDSEDSDGSPKLKKKKIHQQHTLTHSATQTDICLPSNMLIEIVIKSE